MPVTLAGLLTADPASRESLLKDCVQLIDNDVAGRRGISGMAIKATYAVVKRLKPNLILEVMAALLDQFIGAFEPLFSRFTETSTEYAKFPSSLRGKEATVADALLTITDDRAKQTSNSTLRSAYEKLRPHAKKYVEEAVPEILNLLARRLSKAQT